jgi:hypothetical protein
MRLQTYPLVVLMLAIASWSGSASADGILPSTLSSFAVLGGSEVTNTGATTINGNVGVSPINSITGQASITLTGVYDPADATAALAQTQLTTALTELAGVGPFTTLASPDLTLAGTLLPGIYVVPAGTTNLSGALTLNGSGNANAAWVFLMPSSFITSSNSAVTLENTGAGAGIYWVVGTSATLNSSTTIVGNILANDSITMGSGVTLDCGRALASTAAVTMIGDTISTNCAGSEAAEAGSNGLSGGLTVTTTAAGGTVVSELPFSALTPVSTPEPGTFTLLLCGLLPIGFLMLRKLRTS